MAKKNKYHIVTLTAANGREVYSWQAVAVRVRNTSEGVKLDVTEVTGYDWTVPVAVGARVEITEAE